nr:MAG TPA: hypothetical protein [Caudoviricetes sp.]
MTCMSDDGRAVCDERQVMSPTDARALTAPLTSRLLCSPLVHLLRMWVAC